MVLATDLLIGVASGIFLKMVIHVINGVPIESLFKPYIEIHEEGPNTSVIVARGSAVFSNWIPLRRQIEQLGLIEQRNLIIDVSDTQLVDHSVMERLEEMERDFEQEGLSFTVRGLDSLKPFTKDSHSARKRGLTSMGRITVVVNPALETLLEQKFVELGASGYTAIPCRGAGRRRLDGEHGDLITDRIRIEVVVTHTTADTICRWLRREVLPTHGMTLTIETVQVLRPEQFTVDEFSETTSAVTH